MFSINLKKALKQIKAIKPIGTSSKTTKENKLLLKKFLLQFLEGKVHHPHQEDDGPSIR